MGDCLKVPLDIFIEKTSLEIQEEYQVYCLQEDGWYNELGKRIDEKAISTNGFACAFLAEAQDRLKSYLSIKGREGLIIKRVIITHIDSEGPIYRSIQMTETVIEKGKS